MKFEQNPKQYEQIGVGAYKRAYKIEVVDGTPKVQLVMKHEHTNEQMKGLFYLNKIATALFPEKIAAVHQAGNFERDDAAASQFLTEYHEPDTQHKSMQHYMKALDGKYWADSDEDEELIEAFSHLSDIRGEELENNPEVQDFRNAYEAAGFHSVEAAIGVTWGAQDVIFKKDGGFIYVDIDIPWDEPEGIGEEARTKKCIRFDSEKLQVAIDAMPQERRATTQAHFDRLMDLCRAAGFSV
jgi:hypothetical protein